MRLLDQMKDRPLLLDGGLGTELMRRGFLPGGCPEEWNVARPDEVQAIHRAYFAAGSDIVNTNTFGGSRLKLAVYGMAHRAIELNGAGARLAVQVRDHEFPGRLVAGDIGPCGHLLAPMGDGDPERIGEAFLEQAEALVHGGVDLINIETMFDLTEAQLAVRAARAAAATRPVLVSLAFKPGPKGYRTMMGVAPATAVHALKEAGADMVGCNCEIAAEQMEALVSQLAELNDGLTYAQPNAGQPRLENETTVYDETPDHFADIVASFVDVGARILGGCCGTDPAYIAALASRLRR